MMMIQLQRQDWWRNRMKSSLTTRAPHVGSKKKSRKKYTDSLEVLIGYHHFKNVNHENTLWRKNYIQRVHEFTTLSYIVAAVVVVVVVVVAGTRSILVFRMIIGWNILTDLPPQQLEQQPPPPPRPPPFPRLGIGIGKKLSEVRHILRKKNRQKQKVLSISCDNFRLITFDLKVLFLCIRSRCSRSTTTNIRYVPHFV